MRSLLSTTIFSLLAFSAFGQSLTQKELLSFSYKAVVDQELRESFEKRVKRHFLKLKNDYFDNFDPHLNYSIKVVLSGSMSTHGLAKQGAKGELELWLSPLLLESPDLERLLSHEFFHLMHYQLKPKEEDWVKEGLATYFEFRVHQKVPITAIRAALKTSTTSLEASYDPQNTDPEQYGHNYLFFKFAIRECGEKELFLKLLKGAGVGREGVDNALKEVTGQKGFCQSFSKLAEQFMKARAINELSDFGRSKSLFLRRSLEKLPINKYLANKLSKAGPKELSYFGGLVPAYLPMILPKSAKRVILRLSKEHSRFKAFFVKRSFPVKIAPLSEARDSEFEFILLFKE